MGVKFAPPDPIIVAKIPPVGSKIVAHRESDGEPIYERTVSRVTGKRQKIGPDGKEVWRRNQVSGEAIIPVLQNIRSQETERFVLVDDQRGNVWVQPFLEESPEEKERQRIRAAATQFRTEFETEAVKRGFTAAQLVNQLMGAPAAPEASASEFPRYVPVGKWTLSDGSTFTGKKPEALAAEAALHPEA